LVSIGWVGFNRNVEWIAVLNPLRNGSFDVYIAALKMLLEVCRMFNENFIAPLAGILVLWVNYKLKNEYLHGNRMGFGFFEQNPVRIKL